MLYDDDTMTTLKLLTAETQSRTNESEVILENAKLRARLVATEGQVRQLQVALSGSLLKQERLESLLAAALANSARLEIEKQRLHQQVSEFKQAPFKSRRRRQSREDENTSPKRRGRAKGHPGSGRKRPARIDHTGRVSVGETCPDCDTPFSG